jgi:hypothetical protein
MFRGQFVNRPCDTTQLEHQLYTMGNDSPIVVRHEQGDAMFIHSADIYDAVYGTKDYAAEAKRIRELIVAHKRSPGRTLLEAACGTGKHADLLQADYDITLLDLDPNLLEIAAKRVPGAKRRDHLPVQFHRVRRLGRTAESNAGDLRAPSRAGWSPHHRRVVIPRAVHRDPGDTRDFR